MTATDVGRPLRADAERNRKRILTAAAELFARRGLDVGLDEIARAAGVGTGTVYRRFADKASLVEALFQDRFGVVLELGRAACDHSDPWAALTGFIEEAVAMQLADRGLQSVLSGEGCPIERFTAERDELVGIVDVLVHRAQRSGDLRPDFDVTDMALVQTMLTAAGAVADRVRPGHWRRHLGMLLDGLRTRRAGPTPLPDPPLTVIELQAASTCAPGGRSSTILS